MSTADHFAHREDDGIVVDLFWNRGLLDDEFRVEVVNEREGSSIVLYATTWTEAIDAYYDPSSATRDVLDGNAAGGTVITRQRLPPGKETRP
jgi:hypothetical protein